MKTDYYELLGVARDCDDRALKAAFRKLAMQYHPDKNPGDAQAERKFKEIGEAYETLKDPQKRAAYDRFGHAAFENGGLGGGFGAGSGFGGGFADIFEDIFGSMMGGSGRARRPDAAQRGSDLSYNMEITLEEAYRGKEAQIRVPSHQSCDMCHGSGAKKGSKPEECKTCRGTGRIRTAQGFFTVERTCPSCHGQGKIIADPCPQCHGQGRLQKDRVLTVNIPAGVEDGTRIRLSGEGDTGLRGGPNGDLYIFLAILPHEFFEREGANLFCRVPVAMTTAALGGKFEVSGLDGSKTQIKVPEGTQNGKRFRLKDKGMPYLRRQQMGDMYIELQVETPQKLTKKQRDLLQEFETISIQENSPQAHGFFARMKEFLGG